MKYSSIWSQLKQNGEVEFTVNRDIADTVLQGVKRTKSVENAGRKKAGLPWFSRMIVERTVLSATHEKIKLKFIYEIKI